jgi:hypothetical protein
VDFKWTQHLAARLTPRRGYLTSVIADTVELFNHAINNARGCLLQLERSDVYERAMAGVHSVGAASLAIPSVSGLASPVDWLDVYVPSVLKKTQSMIAVLFRLETTDLKLFTDFTDPPFNPGQGAEHISL